VASEVEWVVDWLMLAAPADLSVTRVEFVVVPGDSVAVETDFVP